MTLDEAARRLKASYECAPQGDTAVSVHLFGIRHAEALRNIPLKEVTLRAGIPASYATELRKGMRLAEHVQIKGDNA